MLGNTNAWAAIPVTSSSEVVKVLDKVVVTTPGRSYADLLIGDRFCLQSLS